MVLLSRDQPTELSVDYWKYRGEVLIESPIVRGAFFVTANQHFPLDWKQRGQYRIVEPVPLVVILEIAETAVGTVMILA